MNCPKRLVIEISLNATVMLCTVVARQLQNVRCGLRGCREECLAHAIEMYAKNSGGGKTAVPAFLRDCVCHSC